MRYATGSVFAILLAAAAPAIAAPAPNLSVDLTGPGVAPNVYAYAGYNVNVANTGNRDADDVQLTIQLPKTATSPQVYVMGTVGAFDGRCALGGAPGTANGTKLVCNLNTVKKGKSTNVAFSVAFPEKTGNLVINATARTSTPGEVTPANNTDNLTAGLNYFTHSINTGSTYNIQHCTGTTLTAYFACTRFPGSVSSHPTQFFGGTTTGWLAIPGQPDYDGTWNLTGSRLTFSYRVISTGEIVAEFSGRGVPSTGCFEGLTRFPDGLGGYDAYVAPYLVCP